MRANLPPLMAAIQFLRDAARAPGTDWPDFVRKVDALDKPHIGDAGACAAILFLQIKPLVKQLTQIEPEADAEMRVLLKSFADVLQHQQNAHGAKPHYADRG